MLFETRLQGAQLICEYDDEAIESTLRVRFFTARGPADQDRLARIDYFVAIARQPDLRVVAREQFSLAVPFEGNRTQVAVTEELEPRIPIESGQTGLLSDPGDAGAFAADLARLLDDPGRRRQLARGALAKVAHDHSLEQAAGRLKHILEHLGGL